MMILKTKACRCLTFVPLMVFLVLAAAPAAQAEYQDSYYNHSGKTLFSVRFDFGGQQELSHQELRTTQKDSFIGFGLGFVNAYWTDVQWGLDVGYQRYKADLLGVSKFDMLHEVDFQGGFRYLPIYATFGIGKMAFRLTASALGGYAMMIPAGYSLGGKFTAMLTAGLWISSKDSGSGLLLEVVYRPFKSSLKLTDDRDVYQGLVNKEGSFCFRIGWLFGTPGG